MKISKVIEALTSIQKEHGDIECELQINQKPDSIQYCVPSFVSSSFDSSSFYVTNYHAFFIVNEEREINKEGESKEKNSKEWCVRIRTWPETIK